LDIHLPNNITKTEKLEIIKKHIIELSKNYENPQSLITFLTHKKININNSSFPIKMLIVRLTHFLDVYNVGLSERFYYIYNNINNVILCQYCQKQKPTFKSISRGYCKYCSKKCSNNSEETKQKSVNTNLKNYNEISPMCNLEFKREFQERILKRYGVKSTLESSEVQEKIKQTNLKKYNFENPLSNPKIQEKIKQTNLKRYKSINPLGNPIIREKASKSIKEIYGYQNAMQNKEVKEKQKNTLLEKYGVTSALKLPEVRNKIKETLLQKYQVNNPMYNSEFLMKQRNTMLEKYGHCHAMQNQKIKEKALKTQKENFFKYKLSLKKFTINYNILTKLDQYTGVKNQKYKFQHKKCGHIFESYIWNGKEPKCPICYSVKSLQENQFEEFLKKINVKYIKNNRKILKPQEIDFYLPDYKLAIELNGLYWHSKNNGKDVNYHLQKTINCVKQNIELIQIFEDEWINKSSIIKKIIKKKITKLNNISNLTLKIISQRLAKKFTEQNNLSNYIKGDFQYGIFKNNGKLISILNFKKFQNEFNILNFDSGIYLINDNIIESYFQKLKEIYNIKKINIEIDLRLDSLLFFKNLKFKKIKYIQPIQYQLKYGIVKRYLDLKNFDDIIYDCGKLLLCKTLQ